MQTAQTERLNALQESREALRKFQFQSGGKSMNDVYHLDPVTLTIRPAVALVGTSVASSSQFYIRYITRTGLSEPAMVPSANVHASMGECERVLQQLTAGLVECLLIHEAMSRDRYAAAARNFLRAAIRNAAQVAGDRNLRPCRLSELCRDLSRAVLSKADDLASVIRMCGHDTVRDAVAAREFTEYMQLLSLQFQDELTLTQLVDRLEGRTTT